MRRREIANKWGWLILFYIPVRACGIEAINSQISNRCSVKIRAFRGYSEQLTLLDKDRPITGVGRAIIDDVHKSDILHNTERVEVSLTPFVPKKRKHSLSTAIFSQDTSLQNTP